MTITVTLPDDIAQHPNPVREALEALVIECYRSEALTAYQARQLLGFEPGTNWMDFLGITTSGSMLTPLRTFSKIDRCLLHLTENGQTKICSY